VRSTSSEGTEIGLHYSLVRHRAADRFLAYYAFPTDAPRVEHGLCIPASIGVILSGAVLQAERRISPQMLVGVTPFSSSICDRLPS
jgi:hypothetical protein